MEERIKNFKDLIVWQKAYELTLTIYRLTKKFPQEEQYGLISQMRRAAVSVVSNIAEGHSRKNKTEYVQFLSIGYGSLSELETQILLSRDLTFLGQTDTQHLIQLKDEIGGMLYTLMQKLR
jgi:four helix bundle protein